MNANYEHMASRRNEDYNNPASFAMNMCISENSPFVLCVYIYILPFSPHYCEALGVLTLDHHI